MSDRREYHHALYLRQRADRLRKSKEYRALLTPEQVATINANARKRYWHQKTPRRSLPGRDVKERILDGCSPEPNTGCWLWLLSTAKFGHGQIKVGGIMAAAHRVSYEAFVGPVPSGLQLDHLCRVPCCVNPDHLEPVTARINWLRGESPGAVVYRNKHGLSVGAIVHRAEQTH